MKACAIIAEYNPFHNGHAYHIAQAKKQSKADVMIAIMSGNFVQRGEFAIVDKWKRAEAALENGIDLVVELPTMASVQSADYFGYEAVRLAKVLDVDVLSFGVEHDDVSRLMVIADRLLEHDGLLDYTMSYHQRMVEFIESTMGEYAADVVKLPNNQLALSYIKALKQLDVDCDVLPIQRVGAQHFETEVTHAFFASGTGIRKRVFRGEDIASFVPEEMADALVGIRPADFWSVLKWRILVAEPSELALIQGVDEGIEYRLKQKIVESNSYEEFVAKVSHKRWNVSRVQRMCLAIVLNMTKMSVSGYRKNAIEHIRILGMNHTGREYIKSLDSVSVVTQFKKATIPEFREQMMFDDIYALVKKCGSQNFRRIIRYER